MAYKRISPQPVIEGGTGIQSATAYAPLCAGTTTTGVFQSAATGISNSGYVLTSNGTSSLPSWQPNSGGSGSGSLILLQTQSISTTTASVTFTNTYLTSSYVEYFVLISNASNDTGSVNFQMDWSTDNGSTYLGSGYSSGSIYNTFSSSSFSNVNSTSTNILTPSLAFGSGITGYIYLNFPQSTYYPTATGYIVSNSSTGTPTLCNIVGAQGSAVVINNIKFSFSSGNILISSANALFSLYAVKQ
jgi:hypothetical protein